jgi:hypothetical protein
MSKNAAGTRAIPENILGIGNDIYHLEAQSVTKKYGSADAVIGEENVDTVALIYMNLEAKLYWLPRFLAYLRTKAPDDSFHFDSMNSKLADATLAYEFKAAAMDDEVGAVRDYLKWVEGHISMAGASALRQAAHSYAVELWK